MEEYPLEVDGRGHAAIAGRRVHVHGPGLGPGLGQSDTASVVHGGGLFGNNSVGGSNNSSGGSGSIGFLRRHSGLGGMGGMPLPSRRNSVGTSGGAATTSSFLFGLLGGGSSSSSGKTTAPPPAPPPAVAAAAAGKRSRGTGAGVTTPHAAGGGAGGGVMTTPHPSPADAARTPGLDHRPAPGPGQGSQHAPSGASSRSHPRPGYKVCPSVDITTSRPVFLVSPSGRYCTGKYEGG